MDKIIEDVGIMLPADYKLPYQKDAEEFEREKIRQMSNSERLSYLKKRSEESEKMFKKVRNRIFLGLGVGAVAGGLAVRYADKHRQPSNV